MSDRSAKLLLEVADSIGCASKQGLFRKLECGSLVYLNGQLGQDILVWARGYREHLAHVMERKEGERIAEARAAVKRDEMRDEEALARVREMAAHKDADDFACAMAEEALKLLEGELK